MGLLLLSYSLVSPSYPWHRKTSSRSTKVRFEPRTEEPGTPSVPVLLPRRRFAASSSATSSCGSSSRPRKGPSAISARGSARAQACRFFCLLTILAPRQSVYVWCWSIVSVRLCAHVLDFRKHRVAICDGTWQADVRLAAGAVRSNDGVRQQPTTLSEHRGWHTKAP